MSSMACMTTAAETDACRLLSLLALGDARVFAVMFLLICYAPGGDIWMQNPTTCAEFHDC